MILVFPSSLNLYLRALKKSVRCSHQKVVTLPMFSAAVASLMTVPLLRLEPEVKSEFSEVGLSLQCSEGAEQLCEAEDRGGECCALFG